MKEVVAAFVAKHAVACKIARVLFLALFLASVPAFAQSTPGASSETTAPPGVWADESGTIAINYGVYGWTRSPNPPEDRSVLSLQNPGLMRNAGDVRACDVIWNPSSELPGLGQEQLNMYIQSQTARDWSVLGAVVSDLQVTTLNGVAVASFRSDHGDIQLFSRAFVTRPGDRPVLVRMFCGGNKPLSENDIALFQAVLASLQLGQGAVERAARSPPLDE